MLRTPRVVMIAPGIRTRTNGDELIAAIVIRKSLSHPREIGVERSVMLIRFVKITSGRIGLPDFHQRIWHGPAVFIEETPADDDALA